MGLKVLNPDVNESYLEFAVVPGENEIRFGMAAVKGVGVGAVEEIIRARGTDGKFKTIEDFAKRVSTSKCNKKTWESLVKAGGFDELGERSDILFNMENILAFASKLQKEALSGQTDLFGALQADNLQPTMELKPAPGKYTDKEKLMWERELLGLYISAHPLDNFDAFFEEQMIPLRNITPAIDGQGVTIGGLVTTLRTIVTKSGSKMAFVGLEDKTGETEVIVFPSLYEQIGQRLAQDAVIKVTGKVNARDKDGNSMSDAKLIADQIDIVTDKELAEYESTGRKMQAPTGKGKVYRKKASTPAVTANAAVAPKPVVAAPAIKLPELYVHIKNPNDTDLLLQFKKSCADHPGQSDVIMVLGEGKDKAIRMPFRVDGDNALVGKLAKILGEDCVSVK
jgi:DNA polymerase-3 subunit alpha